MEECIFCRIARGEFSNQEKIYENDNFFSIPDAKPVLEGHSLVISKKHFENSLELPDSLGPDLLDCIKNTALILMKKFNAEGFNIINNNFRVSGQIVNHVHFHIIPRKKDDGFRTAV
jgi:histidine triad (HIT) family protein